MIIEYSTHVSHYSKCLICINTFSPQVNVIVVEIILTLWRRISEFKQGPTAK